MSRLWRLARRGTESISWNVIAMPVGSILGTMIPAAWAVVAGMPAPVILAFVLALLFNVWGTIAIVRERRQRLQSASRVPTPELPASAPPPFSDMRVSVSPEHLSADLVKIDLSGLWAGEPNLKFHLAVHNHSPFGITLDGIRGLLVCNGEECNDPPLIEASYKLGPASDPSGSAIDVVIRQKIGPRFASQLQSGLREGSGRVIFVPARWRWIGTAETPAGAQQLPVCAVLAGRFAALGPIRRGDTTLFAQRMPAVFASPDWYSDEGHPKRHVILPDIELRFEESSTLAVGRTGRVYCDLHAAFMNHRPTSYRLVSCSLSIDATRADGSHIGSSLPLTSPETPNRLNMELPGGSGSATVHLVGETDMRSEIRSYVGLLRCQFFGYSPDLVVELTPLLESLRSGLPSVTSVSAN